MVSCAKAAAVSKRNIAGEKPAPYVVKRVFAGPRREGLIVVFFN